MKRARVPGLVAVLLLGSSHGECSWAAQADAPTFARDVAPLVYERCAPCHRPGGSAPFALLDYEAVRKKGRQIVQVTASGLMPPWLPSRGPEWPPLADERGLSTEEKDVLARWVAAGAPEGDPENLPEPPRFAAEWELGEPDLVVRPDEAFELPADGPDVFQNFVLPLPTDRLRFVDAFELRAGSLAVHHAIAAVDRTPGSARLTAEEPGPGFAGMDLGFAEAPDGHFLGWTPGKRAQRLPEGMAWRLHPGSYLVLQVHLTPTGKVETIRPEVAFSFTDEPPVRFPHSLVLYSEAIDIPAGEREYVVCDDYELKTPVQVLGFYPHAHYLARRMLCRATLPDGSERELFRIEAWDFDWQDEYRFADPVSLPKGTELSMIYTYDNSADNPANPHHPPRRVTFGEQSDDEMATLTLTLLPTRPGGLNVLRVEHWRHAIRKKPYDWIAHRSLASLLIELGDLEGAEEALGEALRLHPDYADAACDLGLIAEKRGTTGLAGQVYRRVLELDPDHARAHFYLGRVLLAEGDVSGAIREVGAALEVHPNWAEAHEELGMLLASSGNGAEAIEHFRRVLELRAPTAEAHNNLATAYFGEGRFDEAVAQFESALALRSSYFNARLNLGRVLRYLGRNEEARLHLEHAARLAPDHPIVRAELEGLRGR